MSRTRTKPRLESLLVVCACCGALLERRQAVVKGQRLECVFCTVGAALAIVDKAEQSLQHTGVAIRR